MRYPPLWQQGNTYPAGLDRSLLGAAWPLGGVLGAGLYLEPTTMNVDIAPGTVVVPLQAGQGAALCRWDANEVVALAPATHPAGQTRRDLIVCHVRDIALDGGAANDFRFEAITGTPATTAPALPTAGVNQLGIWEVVVPGAAANLGGAGAVDRRGRTRSAVWRAGAWNTQAATGTVFIFDTVEDDPAGLYGTATGLFTAPVSGRWLVTANLSCAGTAAAQWLRVQLMRNGATVKAGPRIAVPSAQNLEAALTTVQRLTAGDTLAIAYWCFTAGLTGTASQQYTWAAFDYLGM